MQMILVGKERVGEFWNDVEPLLSPSFRDTTPDKVRNELDSGGQQLFIGHDGHKIKLAMTTSVCFNEAQKSWYCLLLYMGGSDFFNDGFNLLEFIEDFARHNKCTEILSWVRPGLYRRKLKHLGFQYVEKTNYGVLVFKELYGNKIK